MSAENILEPEFTEDGIQVYELNDREWWVGRDKASTIDAALKMWGMTAAEADLKADDVHEMGLDANKINVHPDAEEGAEDIVTYREGIRRHIAAGEPVPGFFCGES